MENQLNRPQAVTELLLAAGQGRPSAAEQLLPIVYEELRALAGSFLAQQHPAHTLQPTALVHEAYIKLVGAQSPEWTGRAHFFAVAAKAMRQILVNHARGKNAAKRGGNRRRITLDEAVSAPDSRDIDLEDLDAALTRLEQLDPRQYRIVELRFLGGMTVHETAGLLELSDRTVELEWRMAKARLRTYLVAGDMP